MQITAIIAMQSGGDAWEEELNTGNEDPQAYCERIIAEFNERESSRPGYEPRELLRWKAADNGVDLKHAWEKTSLVTEAGGYDKMRCTGCGATGKRHGVGQDSVIPDSSGKNRNICKGE